MPPHKAHMRVRCNDMGCLAGFPPPTASAVSLPQGAAASGSLTALQAVPQTAMPEVHAANKRKRAGAAVRYKSLIHSCCYAVVSEQHTHTLYLSACNIESCISLFDHKCLNVLCGLCSSIHCGVLLWAALQNEVLYVFCNLVLTALVQELKQ